MVIADHANIPPERAQWIIDSDGEVGAVPDSQLPRLLFYLMSQLHDYFKCELRMSSMLYLLAVVVTHAESFLQLATR